MLFVSNMKIFLVIFDTLRKDHTGKTYGNSWIQTPHFDEFAKDAIVFDKAYPESLPTIPVRRAIHTGIRTFPFNNDLPFRTDDFVEAPGWSPIPHDHTHISEHLNRQNYLTTFITSTYHQFKPCMNFQLGFDEWHLIRGHEYDKFKPTFKGSRSDLNSIVKKHIPKKTSRNRGEVQVQKLLLKKYFTNIQDRKKEEEWFPAKTFKKALESIELSKDVKNHFVLIDEFDPHEPWNPPATYWKEYLENDYGGSKIIQPIYGQNLNLLSKEELKCMRSCYAGEVSLCDSWFGYFIERVKQMELYEDSLIILISDHGHNLGEHGSIGKVPQYMFPELVDLPLMIKPPGNMSGTKRVGKSYVYNYDILATIFGFLGKEIPKEIEGSKDLSVFVEDGDHLIEGRDYITCGMSLWTLYKDNDYALITKNDKSDPKLFDLAKDPEWKINIADGNSDIIDNKFNIIESDAQGELIQDFQSERFENFEDWYHNTYLL
ncbi:MAG: sulfatase-like hydrolase/transferase [Candidatus Lokiarchaeota archaeon]|nr:sulfatase-like hydrolase/transferase [Candidatus Lokiarchaeota archaeon]MBD3339609.1 sulfatase-like hydrolase/transferase [Candidatus Lokiarchaeota archaeon]